MCKQAVIRSEARLQILNFWIKTNVTSNITSQLKISVVLFFNFKK